MSDDINTRATAALRTLEAAGVIESAAIQGQTIIACVEGEDGLYVMEGPGSGGFCKESWILFYESRIYGDADDVTNVRHDLSDPVTAASLIALVREAYGAHAHCVRTTGGVWGVWVFDDRYGPARSSSRVSLEDTEVEALVAALEAKVREVKP